MEFKKITSIFVFLCILLTITLVNADIGFNLKPLDSFNNTIPNTYFTYNFNFTLNYNCNNVILSISKTVKTFPDGTAFVLLDTSSLNQQPKFLCVYRDSVLVMAQNYSDLILNSLRVNDIYGNSANFTNNLSAKCYYYSDGTYSCTLPTSLNYSSFTNYSYYGAWINDNSSWNESYVNGKYYSSSNPSAFYNSTTAPTYLNDTWSSNMTNYYNKTYIDNNNWNSTYNATYDSFYNTNSTIVRSSAFNCSSGFIQNITINSSGIFGLCTSISANGDFFFNNFTNSFKLNNSINWNITQSYNRTEIDNNFSLFAKYNFTNSNFNGSGNFNTAGNITSNNFFIWLSKIVIGGIQLIGNELRIGTSNKSYYTTIYANGSEAIKLIGSDDYINITLNGTVYVNKNITSLGNLTMIGNHLCNSSNCYSMANLLNNTWVTYGDFYFDNFTTSFNSNFSSEFVIGFNTNFTSSFNSNLTGAKVCYQNGTGCNNYINSSTQTQFTVNQNFTKNITLGDNTNTSYICYNPSCTTYMYYNGTGLKIHVG